MSGSTHRTCRRPTRWILAAALSVAFILSGPVPSQVWADRQYYTIGGRGTPWSEVAERWVALDDTTIPGAIRPKELMPWENILVGPRALTNIFGFAWHFGKTGLEEDGHELGLNPRLWKANYLMTPSALVDGDELTFTPLIHAVHAFTVGMYSQNPGARTLSLSGEIYTLDLGLTTPVNRIRFYPRQDGSDPRGVAWKRDAPQAFEVSVAQHPRASLLLESEDYPHGPLDMVVATDLANTASIVEVTFPLQPARFIRLDLSLRPQVYSLAEIEAYGAGFPQKTRFASRVIDMGEPVNLGRVLYALHSFHRGPDSALDAVPEAPVHLALETRTGLDDTPTVYYVVDHVGRDSVVTQEEFDRAPPPRPGRKDLRFPGMQSATSHDAEMWSAWSSSYRRAGEWNRSPDGRRYLQFRFTLESDDVLIAGQLDSLQFEYSPLLVQAAVGEVSLARHPQGGAVALPAGETEEFDLNIRAVFSTPSQTGFNGVRLDVPPGSRFVEMAMGDPLTAVDPDSVREGERQIEVFFDSHRITSRANRRLRLRVEATLLNSILTFTGDVVDTDSDNLPQSIEPGDANPQGRSDGLQVFASQSHIRPLAAVEVSPSVMTPNGDEVNDEAQVRYYVMVIESGRVSIEVLDLGGRRVRALSSDLRGQGSHSEPWDGRDDRGALVTPGIYVCRVSVDTESGVVEDAKPIVVAY